MNPEEYYRNELEKKCESKINEMSKNQNNKYWEIIKEATEETFPSCKVVTASKEYDSLKGMEYKYDKSQIVKSQNKVSHYLNIGKHLIELEDSFIYYPEIHPLEDDIVIFEADYIKGQISELNENVLKKAESYQKEVAQIYGLKDELKENFKKERIPFISKILSKMCFVKSNNEGDTTLKSSDVNNENEDSDIVKPEFLGRVEENPVPISEESFENIDDYDDTEDSVNAGEENGWDEEDEDKEYEEEKMVEPNFCDFPTSYHDFDIEEPDFEEEFDYGEPDLDMEGEEVENISYVDTDVVNQSVINGGSGIVSDDEIVDNGFTQRINFHKREFNQLKKSRYGNLYAGQR